LQNEIKDLKKQFFKQDMAFEEDKEELPSMKKGKSFRDVLNNDKRMSLS
jgi:hypothetical protein